MEKKFSSQFALDLCQSMSGRNLSQSSEPETFNIYENKDAHEAKFNLKQRQGRHPDDFETCRDTKYSLTFLVEY